MPASPTTPLLVIPVVANKPHRRPFCRECDLALLISRDALARSALSFRKQRLSRDVVILKKGRRSGDCSAQPCRCGYVGEPSLDVLAVGRTP